MAITTSKLEEQGKTCAKKILACQAERYSSEDLHQALFDVPPEPHSLEEMEEGIRANIKRRHAPAGR